ncbi:MAG TPA: hypothetical protein VEY88_21390, partial [Archangium sp.]|nr:hypothetical protein [Archangium sp.]
ACAFTFVAAGRLLRPGGLPLERVRRLLGAASIVAALLRTIDGAQWAVVARRMAVTLVDALRQQPEFQAPEMAAQLEPTVLFFMSASTMLQTAVMAGTFALLGQYFRSETVRQAVIAHGGDDLAEEED